MLKTCRDCNRFYTEYLADGRCGYCHNAFIDARPPAPPKPRPPAGCEECDHGWIEVSTPLPYDPGHISVSRCPHCRPLPAERQLRAA